MKKLFLLIMASLSIAGSMNAQTKISNVEATSTPDFSVIAYPGVSLGSTPTITVTKGSPAVLDLNPTHYSWEWQKWNETTSKWEGPERTGLFTAGKWRFKCQVRIDPPYSTNYWLEEPMTVKVNGVEWKRADNIFLAGNSCSYVAFVSPEYVVSANPPADTRTVISSVSASSSNFSTIPDYLAPTTAKPTFSQTAGSPAYFSTNGTWQKWEGSKWVDHKNSADAFDSGTWRYKTEIRIDGDKGTTHRLGQSLTVTVNGEAWEVDADAFDVKPWYSVAPVYSPSFFIESVSSSDTRTPIRNVVATSSDLTTIPVDGASVTTKPTVTVTTGSPAFFKINTSNGSWQKKNGTKWEDVTSGYFSQGEWRFSCQLRIDPATTHRLGEPLTVSVNGEEWEVKDLYIYNDLSYANVSSPAITVRENIIVINEANFPDGIFRNYLMTNENEIHGYGKDGQLTATEIAEIGLVNVKGLTISDLTGIEYFTSLVYLWCDRTNLTALNVSGFKKLQELSCANSSLESLNVTGCTSLTKIWCYGNKIKGAAMDAFISSLPTVTGTDKVLLVRNNDRLGAYNHDENVISKAQAAVATSKGWSVEAWDDGGSRHPVYEGATLINSIEATSTQNFALVIPGEPISEALNPQFKYNHITAERFVPESGVWQKWDDTSKQWNTVSSGNFTSGQWRLMIQVEDGDCSFSSQITLPFTAKVNGAMWTTLADQYQVTIENSSIYVASPVVTVGDVTGTPINATNFPDVNFRNFLLTQDYGKDGILTDAEIDNVYMLMISNKGIKDLTGIGVFKKLGMLYCNDNQLTTLDLSQNKDLISLDCYSNNLTALSLLQNTKLVALHCDNNMLTSLDVSPCPNLTTINCSGNHMSGTGMATLVNSLSNAGGTLYICDDEVTPDNFITPAQVKTATDKGWKVYKRSNSGTVEYAGATGIEINAANFPDENFRTFLKTKTYGKDDFLTPEELAGVTEMVVHDKNMKIGNLAGIQYFTALEKLECYGNQLKTLNVSGLKNLKWLDCSVNQIKGVEMDALVASLPTVTSGEFHVVAMDEEGEANEITVAQVAVAKGKGWTVQATVKTGGGTDWADYTNFLEINATNFPDENFRNYLLAQDYGKDGYLLPLELEAVTTLDVPDMGIATLTGIEHFTDLLFLYCAGNSLTSLDLSQNTKLVSLHCSSNSLTSLDLSNNTGLLHLYCNENNLESLDLSQNTDLVYLACPLNKLTSLDVSSCPNLAYLSCYGNSITGDAMATLVNGLPQRTTASDFFVCSDKCSPDNTITTAQAKVAKDKKWTVKKETASGWVEYAGLDPVAINATNFPDQKFREYLIAQDYGKDGVLTEIELRAVTVMDVSNKGISNLKGIEYFTKLTNLNCSQNSLTSLDVSKNTALVFLDCYMNTLGSLNVSNHAELSRLTCTQCGLTSLDVSNCPKLTKLECYRNKIEGTEMDKLVNGMPSVTGICWFNVCDDYITPDNIITAAQVKVARDKGWSVMKRQSIFYGGVNYAGWGDVNGDNKIDEADLDAISMIIMGKMADIDVGIEGKYIDSQFAGDLNNDMKTNAADIVIMVNILKSLGK